MALPPPSRYEWISPRDTASTRGPDPLGKEAMMIGDVTTRLDPALHRFLDGTRRQPPLAPGEEAELLARVRRGDREAVDIVVDANLRHVVDAAMLVDDRGNGLGLRDLFAEGTVALVAAVRRYDPHRDGPFRAHAVDRIRRAMLDPEL
ncbi:hypothetical protein GF314_14235 [bacterium]|nr:hypothetical protein [bacterium]